MEIRLIGYQLIYYNGSAQHYVSGPGKGMPIVFMHQPQPRVAA